MLPIWEWPGPRHPNPTIRSFRTNRQTPSRSDLHRRRVDAAHHIVAEVRDVDVARSIDGHTLGRRERGCFRGTAIAGIVRRASAGQGVDDAAAASTAASMPIS